MKNKINKNKNFRLKCTLALNFAISSSFLLTSYALPIKALEISQNSGGFIIAKTPDERQTEAVQQGIEQIPVSQPPASRPPSPQKPKKPESPIPVTKAPTTPASPTPSNRQPSRRRQTRSTPQPTYTQPSSRPTGTRSAPNNKPTQQRTYRRSSPSRSQGSQRTNNQIPNNNQDFIDSPDSPSQVPNPRQINFVDIPFGILAPGDFKSQGRYFHFYQFEGRENQLVQIRLIGSADHRRSNNLSLDPFMILLDPNHNVLVKRGSGETTNNAGVKDAFVFVRLPVQGTYTIAVTSRNPGEIGRYSLALRNDRASYAVDEYENLTASSLTRKNGGRYNVSRFQGKKDQLVSIRVDSTYEEFSPYIVLLNSQGQIVAADNDKDGKYTALIDRARLPKDDTYYVVVLSNDSGATGRYRLTVF